MVFFTFAQLLVSSFLSPFLETNTNSTIFYLLFQLNGYEDDPYDIPRFLRCEGEIVNRRIGRRDCAVLINDIWKERTENMKEVKSIYPCCFLGRHF